MLEFISEIFYSCCTLKKNQKDDEYIFILCPAPSDLEEEYIDENGNIKKKKLERVRGTARSIVDNEVVREWSGREIGSCICCHLIYEDEMNVYRADKYGQYTDKNQGKNGVKSVGSLSSYSSKKHFSDESYSVDTNSTLSSSDEDANTNENNIKRVKGRKKSDLNGLSTTNEEKLDEKDKRKKKHKKRAEGTDVDKMKEPSRINSDHSANSNSAENKIADNGNDRKSSEKSKEAIDQQNLSLNSKKHSKTSIPKHQNPPRLAKRPPLKNELFNTSDQKNKHLGRQITNSNKQKETVPTNSQKKEVRKVDLEKDKVNENNNNNHHVLGNNNQNHDSDSLVSDKSDSNSGSDKEATGNSSNHKYDEEEMKFNKDISSKIIRQRASVGIQAEIILKDGSIMSCKVSFSDMEKDLSFICDDKVKAVPWSNVKEIFTTKNELKMVNTRAPIFKDPSLIIALHLKDTGNCIPLKFNSKRGKEDFLKFAVRMIK